MNSDYADVVPDVSWQLLVEISKYARTVFFPGGKIVLKTAQPNTVLTHM